jgi:trimeric autotransporter adhesin
MRARFILASTCLAFWLTACGGGGGDGGESFAVSLATPAATPQPRQLSLGFAASGTASASITVYRVQWRPDAQTAYAQIGADLGASATTSVVELPSLMALDWAQASVRVQACDAANTCVTSNEQPLLAVLPAMVGYFKASNTGAEDIFGRRVVLSADGQTMAVAASDEGSASDGVDGNQGDNSAPFSGAVYVFARGASGWVQQAYLKASNSESEDAFGRSVAISADGSVIAVGASGEDSSATGVGGDEGNNAASNSGAVYLFSRAGGAWSQSAYIKASNTGASDAFGWSVALSGQGDRLAVGALEEGNSGAAYVFERNATGWVQTALLKASNAQLSDWFGFSLVLSANGSTLAVAAREEDSGASGVGGDGSDNSVSAAGAVYVFERTLLGDAWLPQGYLKASNPDINDRFGHALALSADGDTLAVGAIGEDSAASGVGGDQADGSASSSGAVYTFARNSANVWTQRAYVKASNTGASDSFGVALALSADGRTLAVGAHEENSGARGIGGAQDNELASGSGAVYLFASDGTNWTQRHYVKAPDGRAHDNFGLSLALSADGSTLAVGAIGEDSAATGIGGDRESTAALGSGSVYLY